MARTEAPLAPPENHLCVEKAANNRSGSFPIYLVANLLHSEVLFQLDHSLQVVMLGALLGVILTSFDLVLPHVGNYKPCKWPST